jgi:hypothetical protein
MKKIQKILYKVQCFYNPDHIFEKAYNIEEGSEGIESEIQPFCPFCEKHVKVTIQGKVVPDKDILMKFNVPSDDL